MYVDIVISNAFNFLLIVCCDIESNPGSDRVRVLYSDIRYLYAIWASWLWVDRIMIFWFVLSLTSLITDISKSSVSLPLVAPKRCRGTPHLVPRIWLFILGKDSAPSGRASWSVLATRLVCLPSFCLRNMRN